jgi:competence protein ComEC
MYYRYIIATTLGVFCGTLISFTCDFSSEIFLVSLFLFLMNLIVFKFKNNSYTQNERGFSLALSILFIAVSFGIILGQVSLYKDLVKGEKFSEFISNKNIVIGKINDVKQKSNSQEIILNVSGETENNFNIKINTNNIPAYNFGETISVEGKISTSSVILPSLSTNNSSINTENLNKLNNIDGEMAFPKIKILTDSDNSVFDEYISKIKDSKRQFVGSLEKTSSVHGAALGSGTLIGDASLFSKDEMNDFRLSGLSHIIVVSGFNVTIIIFVLIYLFSFLNIKLKFRIPLLILSILLFISFIGFGSSVVRAGFMAVALLLAYLSGRGYSAKQTLFLVSLVMIILNPRISAYDISFHLSFLATFAILFVFPILRSLLKINLSKEKVKNNFLRKTFYSLYEIFLVTMSIQIVTLPYLSFIFGYVSIFGVFANILVLPVLPLIMLLGFLTFLFSFSFYISSVFGFLLSIFSNYVFWIAKVFGSLSFSKLEINFSFLFLVIYYFCLILFLIFETKRKEIKKYLEKI